MTSQDHVHHAISSSIHFNRAERVTLTTDERDYLRTLEDDHDDDGLVWGIDDAGNEWQLKVTIED
jgi:hypothetical protein